MPRRHAPGGSSPTPLYGQLVSEWRARGAMLPGARDPQWDRLTSLHAFEEDTRRTLRMLRLERDPLPAPPEAGARVPAGNTGNTGHHPAVYGAAAHLPGPRRDTPGNPRPRGYDRES
ncbi:hypothetical protein DDQ41_16735 [Streptomyces spongiicola]|uniref:Uncharacterized protein n=1 Tax=Streptomyces spongiicola TaxID=1690221 RepID=A0ABM6VFL0_9ACTN|nr:hypothetical protein DDQ41_16735 [Streptomyces spongiicola]